jgi:hypothetical protein
VVKDFLVLGIGNSFGSDVGNPVLQSPMPSLQTLQGIYAWSGKPNWMENSSAHLTECCFADPQQRPIHAQKSIPDLNRNQGQQKTSRGTAA